MCQEGCAGGEPPIPEGGGKGITKRSVISAVFLYVLLFSGALCKAAIVWSDDFDDGEYDG